MARLWWKLAEIEVPPLAVEHARALAQEYLEQTGMRVESPALFIGHVVQQANGNPQALADLLADASKERRVDKRKIREMRHAAGVKYLDFTPVMIVALASVIGARYLAIGTGDTELYVFAGMLAAVILSLRVFLFKGAGKANERERRGGLRFRSMDAPALSRPPNSQNFLLLTIFLPTIFHSCPVTSTARNIPSIGPPP